MRLPSWPLLAIPFILCSVATRIGSTFHSMYMWTLLPYVGVFGVFISAFYPYKPAESEATQPHTLTLSEDRAPSKVILDRRQLRDVKLTMKRKGSPVSESLEPCIAGTQMGKSAKIPSLPTEHCRDQCDAPRISESGSTQIRHAH